MRTWSRSSCSAGVIERRVLHPASACRRRRPRCSSAAASRDALEHPLVARRRDLRQVRRLEREVEEERLAGRDRVADEGLRLLAQHVGRVVGLGAAVGASRRSRRCRRARPSCSRRTRRSSCRATRSSRAARRAARVMCSRAARSRSGTCRSGSCGSRRPAARWRYVRRVARSRRRRRCCRRSCRRRCGARTDPARMLARLGQQSGVVMNASVNSTPLARRARRACRGMTVRHAVERVRRVGRVPALVVGQDEEDVRAERLGIGPVAIDPHLRGACADSRASAAASTGPPGAGDGGRALRADGRHDDAARVLDDRHRTLVGQLVDAHARLQVGLGRRSCRSSGAGGSGRRSSSIAAPILRWQRSWSFSSSRSTARAGRVVRTVAERDRIGDERARAGRRRALLADVGRTQLHDLVVAAGGQADALAQSGGLFAERATGVAGNASASTPTTPRASAARTKRRCVMTASLGGVYWPASRGGRCIVNIWWPISGGGKWDRRRARILSRGRTRTPVRAGAVDFRERASRQGPEARRDRRAVGEARARREEEERRPPVGRRGARPRGSRVRHPADARPPARDRARSRSHRASRARRPVAPPSSRRCPRHREGRRKDRRAAARNRCTHGREFHSGA